MQQDHLTPSNDFIEILNQGTEGANEKSTEESYTADDLIDLTGSTDDSKYSTDFSIIDTTTGIPTTSSETDLSTDFQEQQHIARSGKPLRNTNKEDFCEDHNSKSSVSTNGKFLLMNKKRGAKKHQLFYKYHHLHGGGWQGNNFFNNDDLHGNGLESDYNKNAGLGEINSGFEHSGDTYIPIDSSGVEGGVHSEPNFWDESQSGDAGVDELYDSSKTNAESATHIDNEAFWNSEGSDTHHDWEGSSSDYKTGSEPQFESFEQGSNYRPHFSHEYIDTDAHTDYMDKTPAETYNGGKWRGGQSDSDLNRWNHKKSGGSIINNNNNNNNYIGHGHNGRVIINNNNNNNNYNGHGGVIINNNNNNNNVISSRFRNPSNPAKRRRKKKKLSLISFNSIHTNNNINNNNNAEGAVNFNDVNNSHKGNNAIKGGQNNCWFVVCLGLYVNDAKFTQLSRNRAKTDMAKPQQNR